MEETSELREKTWREMLDDPLATLLFVFLATTVAASVLLELALVIWTWRVLL